MIEPTSDIKIYGLEDSIRRSKYPKSVNIESLNNNITETVRKLAKSRKIKKIILYVMQKLMQ